jgi:hypothetical protein
MRMGGGGGGEEVQGVLCLRGAAVAASARQPFCPVRFWKTSMAVYCVQGILKLEPKMCGVSEVLNLHYVKQTQTSQCIKKQSNRLIKRSHHQKKNRVKRP